MNATKMNATKRLEAKSEAWQQASARRRDIDATLRREQGIPLLALFGPTSPELDAARAEEDRLHAEWQTELRAGNEERERERLAEAERLEGLR